MFRSKPNTSKEKVTKNNKSYHKNEFKSLFKPRICLNPRFRVDFQHNINNLGLGKIKEYHVLAVKHGF